MTALAEWSVRPLADGSGIPAGGVEPVFQAPWASTVDVLVRELSYLRAQHVLLELEIPGLPAVPGSLAEVLGRTEAVGPRVRLSFDSRHGPLSYGTGRFGVGPIAWRANLRAVALGLDALRRVDRYGIAPGGEQYHGWLTLAADVLAGAARVLLELSGATAVTATQVLADVGTFRQLYRAAARRLDPEAGGDLGAWHRLQRARLVLADHHGQDVP